MSLPPIEQASIREWLDQLVANELNEVQRAELFRWLEAETERWRDCGLAFLEAQTWASAFGELETTAPRQITIPSAPLKASPLAGMGKGLAIAVSLLLTFFCGTKWTEYRNVSKPPTQFVTNTASTTEDATKMEIDPTDRPTDQPSMVPSTHPVLEISAFRRNPAGKIEKVNLPVTAVESNSRHSPTKIKRNLEDRGYAVKTEQRYVPATMADGRKVMLPFDQIVADYVGKTVY